MASFKKSVQKIFEDIYKVKKSETILILCDKDSKDFAEKVYNHSANMKYGKENLCFEMPLLKNNGEESSKEAAKLMKTFDINLLLTSKSLTHTKARKNANKEGTRIASCPGMNEDMLKRTIDINYKLLSTVENKILNSMKKAKTVRITTKLGIDLSFKIYNNKIIISNF